MKVVSEKVPNIFNSWIVAAQNQIDDYDKTGDYSVTELCGPPRIAYLTKRHWDEITVDVIDRTDLILGSAVHYILDLSAEPDSIHEQRFKIPILGKLVSMKPDIATVFSTLPSGHRIYTVHDYKIVKAWAVKHGMKPEYEQQLNCYAYGLREQSFDVRYISLEYLVKDWSIKEQVRDPEHYPKEKLGRLPGVCWTHERCKAFLESRVALFEKVKDLPDNSLPFCTEKERWAKPDTYVVKKKDSTKALPKCTFTEKAFALDCLRARKDRDICEIEYRQGKSTRCEGYCAVKKYCNQYNAMIAKGIDLDNPF